MEEILSWIQSNPILDLLILVVVPSVIEVSKININPWSWLGRKVGQVVNGEVISQIDALKAEVIEVRERQEQMDRERKDDKADDARTRIIRAADEIRLGQKHSKEFFDLCIKDCSDYKEHCKKNELYQNDKANMSIALVEETYMKCMKENSFL